MLASPAGREGSLDAGLFAYERHQPEQTLLYQIIEQHYPGFLSAMEAQGRLWAPENRGQLILLHIAG